MTLRPRLTDRLTGSSTVPSLLVVSDSHVGATLAADLDVAAVTVVTDRDAVAAVAPDGVRTVVGDVTTLKTFAAADADEATVAVLALDHDRRTLLVRQLLRTRFDVEDVVVVLNDPERRVALTDASTSIVCGPTCLAAALGDAVERTLPEPTESHS